MHATHIPSYLLIRRFLACFRPLRIKCFLLFAWCLAGELASVETKSSNNNKLRLAAEDIGYPTAFTGGGQGFWYVYKPSMDYLVKHGPASVPYLVQELKGTNAIAAGNAAWCLTRMGCADGKPAAEEALYKLKQKPLLDTRERYAYPLLQSYIESTIISNAPSR